MGRIEDKMLKKISKTFEVILNFLIIIMIFFIILGIYGTIQTQILKKDFSNILGYTIFQVATGSMSRTIEVGDIIIVKITSDVAEDDIIVFKQDGNIITHRLIEINDNSLITRGDANNTEDNPIQKNDVIGKVIKIIPNVAIWKKVFLEKEVYISIIVTIFLFGIAFSYDEKEKIEEKNDK